MADEKVTPGHDDLPTKLGSEFITKFNRLLKGTTLYAQKNAIIDRVTQECLEVINGIIQSEGNLLLKIGRDNFLFNQTPIIPSTDRYPIFKGFCQEMRKRWIGEVEFLEEVNGDNLKELAYLLSGLEENNETITFMSRND